MNTIDNIKIGSLLSIAIVSFLNISGCSNVDGQNEMLYPMDIGVARSQLNASISAISLGYEPRSSESAVEYTEAIAGVFFGRNVKSGELLMKETGKSNRYLRGLTDREANGIRTFFDKQMDTLMITDLAVRRSRSVMDYDIGEKSAQKEAEKLTNELEKSGLIPKGRYDWRHVKVAYLKQFAGTNFESVESKIKEYLFMIPVRVRGIQVTDANGKDFGMRISVSSTGELSSLRISGMGLETRGNEKEIQRVNSTEQLMERTKKNAKNAKKIKELGLRYIVDRPNDFTVREPVDVLKVYPEVEYNGRRSASRAYSFRNSISDSTSTIWPKPEPEATGDLK